MNEVTKEQQEKEVMGNKIADIMMNYYSGYYISDLVNICVYKRNQLGESVGIPAEEIKEVLWKSVDEEEYEKMDAFLDDYENYEYTEALILERLVRWELEHPGEIRSDYLCEFAYKVRDANGVDLFKDIRRYIKLNKIELEFYHEYDDDEYYEDYSGESVAFSFSYESVFGPKLFNELVKSGAPKWIKDPVQRRIEYPEGNLMFIYRVEMSALLVRLPRAMHEKFKSFARRKNESMSKIVVDCVSKMVEYDA